MVMGVVMRVNKLVLIGQGTGEVCDRGRHCQRNAFETWVARYTILRHWKCGQETAKRSRRSLQRSKHSQVRNCRNG